MTIIIMKPYFLLIMIAIIFMFNVQPAPAGTTEDLTIFTLKENYKGTKYEPQDRIYLGAYVLQDSNIDGDMKKFNLVTGKKHASYFKYVGYGKPFPTDWVKKVEAAGAVSQIAFEPNEGLDKVRDDEYLRGFARAAKEAGVPIFLRYASEMNGNWCSYSEDPREYIEKWRLVHRIMEEEAPNVIMVWTVFTFPESTIELYYPGDDYVDWVGLNVYNVIYHNNNPNEKAVHEDPLDLLNYVYNTFSYKKPIMICEYGASHYSVTDKKFYIEVAAEKIRRLYENLPEKYPRVKAVYYFDVNSLGYEGENKNLNNYSLTDNETILNTYKKVIQDENYLTSVPDSLPEIFDEKLSYRGATFIERSTAYADIEFFQNCLEMEVIVQGKQAILTQNGQQAQFKIKYRWKDKGYYGLRELVRGLPIRAVAEEFGYNLTYNPESHSIMITPPAI